MNEIGEPTSLAKDFQLLCKKYDVIGDASFATKETLEFVNFFNTTWSTLRVDEATKTVRFKNDLAEFESVSQKNEFTQATFNALRSIGTWKLQTAKALSSLIAQFEKRMSIVVAKTISNQIKQ